MSKKVLLLVNVDPPPKEYLHKISAPYVQALARNEFSKCQDFGHFHHFLTELQITVRIVKLIWVRRNALNFTGPVNPLAVIAAARAAATTYGRLN